MTRANSGLTVSVIMPLYQGARYCQDALASVLTQTRLPDQVVIVDDGSTDDGPALLKAMAATAPDVIAFQFVSQVNSGQSAARNLGASLAFGDLLALIDQDDAWHPRHLEVLTSPFAEDEELGWVFSDFDEIDSQGFVVTREFVGKHGAFDRPRSLAALVGSDLMVLPSASVLRASAFKEVGGFDPELQGYEDDDLFVRFFRHGWSARCIPGSFTKYRTHTSGSSTSERFRVSRLRYLDKLIASIPNEPYMNRFIVPDVVLPRMFGSTVTDYCIALRVNDHDAARRLAGTAREISNRGGDPSFRRRIELWLFDHPPVMVRFLRLYEALPRRLRPFIHPALSLRRPGFRQ